jgi:hypothetical protein
MITYNWMSELWEDDNDPNFVVDMTPEDSAACEQEFSDQTAFWAWYNAPWKRHPDEVLKIYHVVWRQYNTRLINIVVVAESPEHVAQLLGFKPGHPHCSTINEMGVLNPVVYRWYGMDGVHGPVVAHDGFVDNAMETV